MADPKSALGTECKGHYIQAMFGEFLNRLLAETPDPLTQPDARLALTALLVRIAKTDGDYAIQEIALIEQIAGERYGLNIEEIADLRAKAEELEAEAPDTVRFTKAIKSSVAYEDRLDVIEALWAVVLADGKRHDHENALMRMVAPMLGISDKDSALSRQKVERSKA